MADTAELLGRPLRPIDLTDGILAVVLGGARVSGVRGDAVLSVEAAEHYRRRRLGLGALADLALLNVLMDLPLGLPVPSTDLPASAREVLASAPPGVIVDDGEWVTRLAEPAVVVHAAVVAGVGWRRLIRTGSVFTGVCQSVVVLERRPPQLRTRLWEAELLGVGVWLRDGAGLCEVLPPQVFHLRYVKPARWRFLENAYASHLAAGGEVTARRRPGRWSGASGRRSHTAVAEPGQPQALPLQG